MSAQHRGCFYFHARVSFNLPQHVIDTAIERESCFHNPQQINEFALRTSQHPRQSTTATLPLAEVCTENRFVGIFIAATKLRD